MPRRGERVLVSVFTGTGRVESRWCVVTSVHPDDLFPIEVLVPGLRRHARFAWDEVQDIRRLPALNRAGWRRVVLHAAYWAVCCSGTLAFFSAPIWLVWVVFGLVFAGFLARGYRRR